MKEIQSFPHSCIGGNPVITPQCDFNCGSKLVLYSNLYRIFTSFYYERWKISYLNINGELVLTKAGFDMIKTWVIGEGAIIGL